jgi:transposase
MRMATMNAYSRDLRLKTLAAIDRGIPRREVQELFGVSRSTIKRWLNRRRQTGGVDTMKIPGRPSIKGEALRQWLPQQLKSNPDLTLLLSGSIARLSRRRVAWRSRRRL